MVSADSRTKSLDGTLQAQGTLWRSFLYITESPRGKVVSCEISASSNASSFSASPADINSSSPTQPRSPGWLDVSTALTNKPPL